MVLWRISAHAPFFFFFYKHASLRKRKEKKKSVCVHTSVTTSIMFPTKRVIFEKHGAYSVFSLCWAQEWKAHLRSWEGLRTILHHSWKKASKRLSCLFNFWHFTETDRPTLMPPPPHPIPSPFLCLWMVWCSAAFKWLHWTSTRTKDPLDSSLFEVWNKCLKKQKTNTDRITDI